MPSFSKTGRMSRSSLLCHGLASTCSMTPSRISTSTLGLLQALPRLRVDRELLLVDEEEVHLLHQRADRHGTLLTDSQRAAEDVGIEAVPEAFPGGREDTAFELVEVEAAHPFAVHPVQLLVVEEGRRMDDAGEVELRDELVAVQDLAAVLGPPAEQREVVEHRLRQVAGVAELLERDGAVALGELGPVGAHDQREVRVRGTVGRAERLPQREHPVGGVEQVLAPDDVRDRHLDVVDRVGEEEQRRAVGSDDHEVGDRRPLDAHFPPDEIDERAGARRRASGTAATGDGPRRRARPAARRRDRGSGRRSRGCGRRLGPPRCALAPLLLCSSTRRRARRRGAGRRRRGTGRSGCSGGPGPRPNRGRASGACPGSPRPTPAATGRRRCPRCGGRRSPLRGGRTAS